MIQYICDKCARSVKPPAKLVQVELIFSECDHPYADDNNDDDDDPEESKIPDAMRIGEICPDCIESIAKKFKEMIGRES